MDAGGKWETIWSGHIYQYARRIYPSIVNAYSYKTVELAHFVGIASTVQSMLVA